MNLERPREMFDDYFSRNLPSFKHLEISAEIIINEQWPMKNQPTLLWILSGRDSLFRPWWMV